MVPKVAAFRLLVAASLGCLVLAGGSPGASAAIKDRPLQFLAVFVWLSFVAGAFGYSPVQSLSGGLERMGGAWQWLYLLVFCFLLRSLFRSRDWDWFFRISAVCVGLVALLAIGQAWKAAHYGLTDAPVSTIGNPGLLGGYLLLAGSLAAFSATHDTDSAWRRIQAVFAILAAGAIPLTQNRSALLGLGFALSVFAVFRWRWRALVATAFVALSATIIMAGLRSSALENSALPPIIRRTASSGVVQNDEVRLLMAKAALAGAVERPLLGVGPENFDMLWSRHFDPHMYEVGGDRVVDRVHNAFLDTLATMGLAGLLAIVAIWIALIVAIIHSLRQKLFTRAQAGFLAGGLIGYAAYLQFWFFDFSALLLWVAVVAISGSIVAPRPEVPETVAPGKASSKTIQVIAIAAILVAVGAQVAAPIFEARELWLGERPHTSQDERLAHIERAFSAPMANPSDALVTLLRFVESAAPNKAARNLPTSEARLVDRALQRALMETEMQIERTHRNDARLFIDHARLAIRAASFYSASAFLNYAERDLFAADSISPRHVTPLLYLSAISLGRGNRAMAKSYARRAISVDRRNGESYLFLSRAELADGDAVRAATTLEISIRNGYTNSTAEVIQTAATLEKIGEPAEAASVVARYLDRKHRWFRSYIRRDTLQIVTGSADQGIAVSLPRYWQLAGFPDRARISANAVVIGLPRGRELLSDGTVQSLSAGYSEIRPRVRRFE